jgi:hypothetical protein
MRRTREYAKPKSLSGWQWPEFFLQQSKPLFLEQAVKVRNINRRPVRAHVAFIVLQQD